MTIDECPKKEKARIIISFRIGDDNLEPDKITKMLGVKPSYSHRKNDIIGTAVNARYPSGQWRIESPLPSRSEISDHLTAILDIVEPKHNQIKRLLKQGYLIDIAVGCIYGSNKQSESFTLPSSLVQRLGKLGVEINFNIYT